MKPTQEQILRALNKLVRENKTELKAEKIELGLAKDATDLSKELIEFVKIVVKPIKQKKIKPNAIISLLTIFPVKISGFKVRIKIVNKIDVKNISYF